MRTEDQGREDELRKVALAHACGCAVAITPPETIVARARQFFDFLDGDVEKAQPDG